MGADARAWLWPHQVEAVSAVVASIARQGRPTLVGACGIGKTRIGAAVASEPAGSGRILVVVPRIELLVQTLHVYRAVNPVRLGGIVATCSDPSIAELGLLEGEPYIVLTTMTT